MACCAAVAIVLAAVRAAWSRLTGRELVDGAFPPAARWSAGRAAEPPSREPLDPVHRISLGPALGATVLAYGLLIHLLAATGLAYAATSGASWFARDAVLGVVVVSLLAVRRRTTTASALVAVGAVWFALGAVDMHALGGFEFRAIPVVFDIAFHLSGWWLMVAAAGIAIVQRRQVLLPMARVA